MVRLTVALLLLLVGTVSAGTSVDVKPRAVKPNDSSIYIDRTHPLALGLVSYVLMNQVGRLVDLLRPQLATSFNGTWASSYTGVATKYDGTAQFSSVAADLSATTKASVAILASWDVFDASNDAIATYDWAVGAGSKGFGVFPSYSVGGTFGIFANDGVGNFNGGTFARPSAGVPHAYVFTFDRTTGNALSTVAIVDGVNQAITQTQSVTMTSNFTNSTLYLMSTTGSSGFGPGRVYYVATYNRLLTLPEAIQLYREPYAFIRPKLFNTALMRRPLLGGISRSRVMGGQ